ncbi:MAG: RNA polymerase sigma-70 factor (ECF subfamily) [Saprospiraceae bacterium]|jgi:RNA polymerase sigma-70 factor (ECF subfamily)
MAEPSSYKPLDKSGFENLFKSHFKYLCHFAQQYVTDIDAAQDICQKVFINLWEKRAEIDCNKSLKSYLFTSVKNGCLNHIRDQKKFRSKILDLECADFNVVEDADHLAVEELQDKIEKALNALPEKCRLVFEMSRFRSMKYREIAEELAISPKTVEAHMSKAMKHLRAHLEDYLFVFILWASLI